MYLNFCCPTLLFAETIGSSHSFVGIGRVNTENDLIFIEKDTPFDREQVEEKINILTSAMFSGATGEERCLAVRNAMLQVVPTYRNSEDVNKSAENAEEMKLAFANSK